MTAQSVFQGLARSSDVAGLATLRERLLFEGEPFAMTGNGNDLTLSGTSQSVATLSLPSLSRAMYVETLTMSSNVAVDLQVSFGSNLYTGIGQVHRHAIPAGAPVTVPVNALLRPAYATAGTTSIGGVTSRGALSATTTGVQIRVVLNGISFYDDLDPAADKIALWIGDSINNGTAGITAKTFSFEWLLRNRLRALGHRVRVVNKSISGTTSTQQEVNRSHGMFDLPQIDLICYSMGANDATSDIGRDAYPANAAAAIAWKQRDYPDAEMIVFGSTPHENTTNETRAAVIRTAGQSAVTAAADPKVRFVNLGAAFDRTTVGFYAGTDPGGTRIHPSNTGHAAIDTVIGTWLASNTLDL